MSLAAIPSGEAVFVDANVLVYHFTPHPVFGQGCSGLLARIESGDVIGYSSTRTLGEVAHRLMLFEASMVFGWPSKIVERLKRQPSALQQLTRFRSAVDDTLQSQLQVLAVQPQWIGAAAGISQQHGLLSNDALIVAVMRQHGLVNIASGDTDFDRVAGITRFGPV